MASMSTDDERYVKELEAERREKDRFFKEQPHSPIPWALRDGFAGLAYFPANPAYGIHVTLQRYPKPEPVVLATSKGLPRENWLDIRIDAGEKDFLLKDVKENLIPEGVHGPEHGHEHSH